MRTMLISLIVACSLALVARAADPDTVDSGGCGTIYFCYVPASCYVSAERGKPLEQVKVVAVTEPIFKDCPAIIRFYQYNQFRVYVSIESLLDTSEVSSIELLQTPFGNAGMRTKFSCLNINGKMEGKVEDDPAEPNDPPVIRIPKNVKDSLSNKIKCVFEVTKKSKAIQGNSNDRITIEITGTQNKKTEITKLKILDELRCDPADFEFDIDDKHDKSKKYSEISYRPGEYFCENENYNIEYRLYGNNTYTPVRKGGIKCDEIQFNFDGTSVNAGATIMIRCAIEIKFLCDYDVIRHKNMAKPLKESPIFDEANKKGTSLTCPPEKPHLMVVENGKDRPILNPVFTCAYFGGEPVWTVNSTADQITKEGPPVYCTNELPCNELNPISESNVYMGFVSQTDFLPKCHAEGTMWVGNSEVKEDLKCKGMTGEFYYTDGGGQGQVVNASTKFVCKYREEVVEDKNDERRNEMFVGITAVAGGIGGVVALVVAVVTVFCFFKVRKERRKKEAENHVAFMKYCATVDEKEAAKGGGKETTEGAPEPEHDWTPATMAARYECMAVMANEDEGDLPPDFVQAPKAYTLKKIATGKIRAKMPPAQPLAELPRLMPRHASEAVDKNTLEFYQSLIIKDNKHRKYAEIDPKKPRNPKKKEKTKEKTQ